MFQVKNQTVAFKVSMHCKACSGKVERVLQDIDAVECYSIDFAQQKVTITGTFDSEKLMKKIAKRSRKHVEIWKEKETKKKDAESNAKDKEKKPSETTMNFNYFSDEDPNSCSVM